MCCCKLDVSKQWSSSTKVLNPFCKKQTVNFWRKYDIMHFSFGKLNCIGKLGNFNLKKIQWIINLNNRTRYSDKIINFSLCFKNFFRIFFFPRYHFFSANVTCKSGFVCFHFEFKFNLFKWISSGFSVRVFEIIFFFIIFSKINKYLYLI